METDVEGENDPMEKRCLLTDLNEMITCKICRGYLIDATTVTECLHTFCKSCIVKHLEDANTCPECEDLIHQSHPLDYIAFDRTMQDLVYKIVPDLEKDEFERERRFYADRGLPCPKDQIADDEEDEREREKRLMAEKTPDANTNIDFHRFDEQVNLLLESKDASSSSSEKRPLSPASPPLPSTPLRRKFVRVSSLATVTHLKKFIAKKLLNSLERYKDVDIMCNDEPLYKDHTLKFVYVTRWRTKEPPLKLQFVSRKSS